MKSPIFFRTIIVSLILLFACQAQAPTATPVPTTTATIIPSPSPTATPDPEIISAENANQLVIKFMNMGKTHGSPSFSPDGKWLYQESTAGTYAFDTVSYQEIHLLASSPVATPSPSPRIFSELELLPEYAIQPEAKEAIFSPDTSLIAGYFHDEFTAVWRPADRKLIGKFEGYPLEISADNRLILIGRRVSHETYTEYYMDLYDLQSGEQLGSWGGRRAFFLSSNQLTVESSEGYTRIFDPVIRKVTHAFAGWYTAFSSDEQNVATLYRNKVNIYQVSDGKLLYSLDSGLPSTDAANLRFSANGKILAGFTTEYYCCAGYSNRLFVWQVSDGRLLIDLSRPETLGYAADPSFSLSPDGQTIVIDTRILQVSDGSLIKDLKTYFINGVTNLAFTADGKQLLVAGFQNLYSYWIADQPIWTPQIADPESYGPILKAASPRAVTGSVEEISEKVYSPDGKFTAKIDNGFATISSVSYEWGSFTVPTESAAYPGYSPLDRRVTRVAFSPNGQLIAFGCLNGSVELWDMNAKQMILTIPTYTGQLSYVGGLAFSPDGKFLAIGTDDGIVRLFRVNVK